MTVPARFRSLRAFRSLCVWLALLAGLLTPTATSQTIAALLLAVAVALGWSGLRRVPRAIMLLVAIGAAAAMTLEPEALLRAVSNTAQLGALIVAVLLLSGTLAASRDVRLLSGSLLAGRPLARYLGVAFATGVLAVPLNFGAVAVMSMMVARAKRHSGDVALARNAARAVLRGFALASLCSPLSMSVVLTLTLLPGLRLLELLAATAPFAVAFVLAGAAFREHEPAAVAPTEAAEADEPVSTGATTSPTQAWLRFAGAIAAICTAAYLASHLGGIAYARAVAISSVAAVTALLLVRLLKREPLHIPTLSDVGNELAVLGGSAFLGVLAAQAGASLLGADFGLPVWACPIAAGVVPWLLFAGGAAGLNPIVTGTLVGALLGPIWPPAAVLGLGVGMVCGWGLTVAGTPWSANSLLLSRLTGYDASVAAWRWNLRLSVLGLLVAGLLAGTLTWLRIAT